MRKAEPVGDGDGVRVNMGKCRNTALARWNKPFIFNQLEAYRDLSVPLAALGGLSHSIVLFEGLDLYARQAGPSATNNADR